MTVNELGVERVSHLAVPGRRLQQRLVVLARSGRRIERFREVGLRWRLLRRLARRLLRSLFGLAVVARVWLSVIRLPFCSRRLNLRVHTRAVMRRRRLHGHRSQRRMRHSEGTRWYWRRWLRLTELALERSIERRI